MNSRDEVLARIRAAGQVAPFDPPSVPRTYRGAGWRAADPGANGAPASAGTTGPGLLDVLTERLVDYRANVRRGPDVAALLAAALLERGLSTLVVPTGVPEPWRRAIPPTVRVQSDEPPLTAGELDRVDGVLTGCRVAIAETGTLVLDAGPDQGRRMLSLVPDYCLAVVRPEQVVWAVPDAVARLDPARPLTWISGPSATSDIELSRVEGVHGPRTLEVLVLD